MNVPALSGPCKIGLERALLPLGLRILKQRNNEFNSRAAARWEMFTAFIAAAVSRGLPMASAAAPTPREQTLTDK